MPCARKRQFSVVEHGLFALILTPCLARGYESRVARVDAELQRKIEEPAPRVHQNAQQVYIQIKLTEIRTSTCKTLRSRVLKAEEGCISILKR